MKKIEFNTTAAAFIIATAMGTTMSISSSAAENENNSDFNKRKALILSCIGKSQKNFAQGNMNFSEVGFDGLGDTVQKTDITLLTFFNNMSNEQKELDDDFRKVLNQTAFNYMKKSPEKKRF